MRVQLLEMVVQPALVIGAALWDVAFREQPTVQLVEIRPRISARSPICQDALGAQFRRIVDRSKRLTTHPVRAQRTQSHRPVWENVRGANTLRNVNQRDAHLAQPGSYSATGPVTNVQDHQLVLRVQHLA